MIQNTRSTEKMAAAITRSASRQTYYTIRFLADRERVADAYRAYAYFRWVDDVIDVEAPSAAERTAFANRQKTLLDACYRRDALPDLRPEEQMLADLVDRDREMNSGLQMYLRNMMDVMVFDAERRDRLITQSESSEYTRKLAIAVTEAIYYFMGAEGPSGRDECRYMAVTAAHIVHMLRDTIEDVEAGYFNIPREVLASQGISAGDITSEAYREWICRRVQTARSCFEAGRAYTAQIRNLRCRLAGYAYMARFEWMLGAIERDHYCLRCEYPERKSLWTGVWMGWSTLASVLGAFWTQSAARLAPQPIRMDRS
ncbi:MAG TPA: squalene/phytoene synthase family protein [Anaerolineales bacterium]|nr:squalene/phytoene synthase family protein [Anaerolineales bacterium]